MPRKPRPPELPSVYTAAPAAVTEREYAGDDTNDTQTPNPAPGYYYVTAYDEARPAGRRYAFLAGPYRRHVDAIRDCRRASDMAIARDPWAAFYAFGTCSLEPPRAPVPIGIFNQELGIDPDELAPQPDEPQPALFQLPAPG